MAKRVKQRGDNDCCIAAIANATNNTYKAVKTKYGRMDRKGGLDHSEVCWLLDQFCNWHLVEPRRPPNITEWLRRHQTGKYVVILRILFDCHAIAVIDGKIFGHHSEDWSIVQYFEILETL
jgi:hypothetical protein